MLHPCPRCGTMNSPEFNFCDQCGHGLTLLMEPSPSGLYAFAGKGPVHCRHAGELVQRVFGQKERIEGIPRQVTVACYTMQGLALLEENAGREDPRDIRDQICEIVIDKVHECKGTVNNISNDTIVALFGLPILLKYAAQRAILSAMAVHREVSALDRRLRERGRATPPIAVKIGIHTGQVVAADVRPDLRISFAKGKETAKLAFLMATLAEPGTTSVTGDTWKQGVDRFSFKPLGQRKIKGRDGSLACFRLAEPDPVREISSDPSSGGDEKEPKAPSSSAGSAQDPETESPLRPPPAMYMPWRSKRLQEESIPPKAKLILSLSSFYSVLACFLVLEFLLPGFSPIQWTRIFSSSWANMAVLLAGFLACTLCLYHLFLAAYRVRHSPGKEGRQKLGTVLVREGYITEKDLEAALAEQRQRIGEMLLRTGSITETQLDEALGYQEDARCRLGVALRELGHATDEEVRAALRKRDRKLGEILREKGLISEYALYWILSRDKSSKMR